MTSIAGSALSVGLALGLFLAVVGLILGNVGIFGLAVVVALAGYYGQDRPQPPSEERGGEREGRAPR